jgi:hypothetical protein
MQMQLHQVRVVNEKNELDERLDKLLVFINSSPVFETLDAAEKGRLWQQAGVMRWYSQILGDRIAAF